MKSRKIVCHVCNGHLATDGRVYEKECVSLAEEGYEVHLIAASEQKLTYVERGVVIHPIAIPLSRKDRFIRINRIAKIAQSIGADLYHVHEPDILIPLLFHVLPKPVIWDAHEPYWLYLIDRPWIPAPLSKIIAGFWNMTEKLALRKCSAVITVTEQIAKHYREMHDSTIVLHNYPLLSRVLDERSNVIRDNTCVYTGSITHIHGLHQAIRALGILKSRGILVNLKIAGYPGNDRILGELFSLAEDNQISNQIDYLGVLSREETVNLQRQSSIGINLSLPHPGTELGLPTKMFEFLAAGIPIIYSAVPHWEALFDGCSVGIAVDSSDPEQIADALEKLVTDNNIARRFGSNGLRLLQKKLNWDVEFPKLQNLYQEVIGPPREV